MSAIVTVYATFPDEEEAARVSRVLVEERLAACANILGGCRSIYRWKGEVEDAQEVAVLFKTRQAAAGRLLERLDALHSYETPAAVVWPIADSLPAYARWVAHETAKVI